jgi:predicted nucleic acid-binding protein
MTKAQAKVLRARIVANRADARAGVTLDTGALIQLEKGNRKAAQVLDAATDEGLPIRLPAAVLAEFWNGQHGRSITMLIEAATLADTRLLAQAAGEALADRGRTRRGPGVVDALVAATAHAFGDAVLTTDPDDFRTLAQHFRGLRVIAL